MSSVTLHSAVEPSADDLAGVMSALTAATERLQQAHTELQAEVVRLKAELQDTNEQLRRSRELAALGQMAAGIAHEVRNPLGSIRLFSSMLTNDLEDQIEQWSLASKITQAVDDLDKFVSDILDYAREMKLHKVKVNPSTLFDDAIIACTDLIENNNITIRRMDHHKYDSDSNTHLQTFQVDPNIMLQAFINIIRNGLEAMNRSGGGEMILDIINPDHDQSNDKPQKSQIQYLTFLIKDQGSGVNEDIAEHIFNPFFTTKRAGTGLGLAITHKIIETHNGTISIENNTHGKGATVKIALPA